MHGPACWLHGKKIKSFKGRELPSHISYWVARAKYIMHTTFCSNPPLHYFRGQKIARTFLLSCGPWCKCYACTLSDSFHHLCLVPWIRGHICNPHSIVHPRQMLLLMSSGGNFRHVEKLLALIGTFYECLLFNYFFSFCTEYDEILRMQCAFNLVFVYIFSSFMRLSFS